MDGEAVLVLVDANAERAEAARQHRDAVALLDAQLARAAHGHPAARLHRGERRERRDLVDDARHLVRRRSRTDARLPSRTRIVPIGSPALAVPIAAG